MTDYTELVKDLRYCVDGDKECAGCKRYSQMGCEVYLMEEAADAIEELNKRIDRAVDIYNRNVEKTAMYEVLIGIAPEPPKEET